MWNTFDSIKQGAVENDAWSEINEILLNKV